MRTKFRFQEQLEIYISKNYIGEISPIASAAPAAAPMASAAPAAAPMVSAAPAAAPMASAAPAEASMASAAPAAAPAASQKEKSASKRGKIGAAFLENALLGGNRTKNKSAGRDAVLKAEKCSEIMMPEIAKPLSFEENDYSYEVFAGESELEKRMQHISDSFGRYMMYLVEEKGKTSTEVQNDAWISRKVYSKINTNQDSYHPDKRTAFQICVGLGLNMDETKDLIRRAGYDFSPSEKEDVIWSFFFEREPVDYDIFDISDALEKYGLKPIVVLKSGYEKV